MWAIICLNVRCRRRIYSEQSAKKDFWGIPPSEVSASPRLTPHYLPPGVLSWGVGEPSEEVVPTVHGSAVAPHSGLVFFHPCVWSDFQSCSAASLLRYRRSFSSGGDPSGNARPRSRNTFGSLTQAELSRWNRQTQWSSASINQPSLTEPSCD